jgi:5'-nucleotidase
VPDCPASDIQGVQVTRTGQRLYRDVLVVREDPYGVPYYWIGGDPPTGVFDCGTDFAALANGYISITPIKMDFTDHTFLRTLKGWSFEAWR